ncbi:MAG: DUF898 domain-containing protein [Pseudomonadales bacterium]|nr:DUF898 domain-containing protein [Pseudomonadales bacterium]
MSTVTPSADTSADEATANLSTNHSRTRKQETISFNGSADEFFKIWIVNIALTILTLGIYSAWAKVRTNRYFYGNTELAGSSFEYLATPMDILKGRFVAVIIFAAYTAISELWPVAGLVLYLPIMLVIPWLIIRSLQFRAHNTAYRNIRFSYHGEYSNAAGVYIGAAILTLITAGLAYPYFIYKQYQLLAKRRFGETSFQLNVEVKAFFVIYAISSAILFGVIAISTFAAFQLNVIENIEAFAQYSLAVVLFFMILFMAIGAYIQSRTTNLVWNNLTLGQHEFSSTLQARTLAQIYITNLAAIILTCGLATPWAAIRTARYRLEQTKVMVAGDLDQFTAQAADASKPFGEEIGEAFGLDFGV